MSVVLFLWAVVATLGCVFLWLEAHSQRMRATYFRGEISEINHDRSVLRATLESERRQRAAERESARRSLVELSQSWDMSDAAK